MFPISPGELLAAQGGRGPFGPSPFASWPLVAEKPFPCTRDRRLVYGSPSLAYTLHACWGESPCMEWRFGVRDYMDITERKVARIAEENFVSVRTMRRSPERIVSASYDFRPKAPPKIPAMKIVAYMVASILVFVLLTFM